jgi:hypothetical protein
MRVRAIIAQSTMFHGWHVRMCSLSSTLRTSVIVVKIRAIRGVTSFIKTDHSAMNVIVHSQRQILNGPE